MLQLYIIKPYDLEGHLLKILNNGKFEIEKRTDADKLHDFLKQMSFRI